MHVLMYILKNGGMKASPKSQDMTSPYAMHGEKLVSL